MPESATQLSQHLDELEQRLRDENPTLAEAFQALSELGDIAQQMGLIAADSSYTARISWWPTVAVLGTFSAGKSSFVNHLLGREVQRTGSQAVDDKFTVLCYGPTREPVVLPGSALDADPRFPFHRVSEQLERVASGQGKRTDAYLQLKTCDAEMLRGRILIDSPGFDADAQRTAVLRLVDHIIDLSDLVLVFFDARRPEPGAMRDTLAHLVGDTVERSDSEKFLFVLNQVDATAREDNAEEVVAAWQRCLAGHGLTAGRFYTIYNPDFAVDIHNPEQRARYEAKRDRDLREIVERVQAVDRSRAYRIVGQLRETVRLLLDSVAPRLERALATWRRRVLWIDLIVLTVLVGGGAAAALFATTPDERRDALAWARDNPLWVAAAAGIALLLLAVIHLLVRTAVANDIARELGEDEGEHRRIGDVRRAFERSSQAARPMWLRRPAGWTRRAERRARELREAVRSYVTRLNDHFAQAPRVDGEPGA